MSSKSQTVTPTQLAATHAPTAFPYSVHFCVSRAVVLGNVIRISSSVSATSTPSAVNASKFDTSEALERLDPTMKWPWKPTPSILVPDACRVFTIFNAAVAFAPAVSML